MDHAATHAIVRTLTVPQVALIPGLPLAAFAILIFFGRRLGRMSAWLAVAALAGACAGTLALAGPVVHGDRVAVSWAWLSATDPRWTIGFSVDGLSWIMCLVVTGIGSMIAVYSTGYMADDPRFSRFFAYFSLFCASMLTLVMADHFVLLYAGWELVGLCSYLLISFWFEKPAAAAAGQKAFLTTRVGDTGLLLGILLLIFSGAALHFDQLGMVRAHLPQGLLTVISLCIFLGAVGKSAQFPLHVWLPDAMEGPTPVSALIHAATMVAAGVYLVARTMVLFTPESLQIVLAIGVITHLFAATIALTQTDIKRILAYSTLSQLGLMVTALGIGAAGAAMFHLVTHALFKALLFLGAGSVIHATHEQELDHLGGLRKRMPWTSTLFLIASLSMGGCVFLSGFWSKDAILLAAREVMPWLMWVLLGGAAMTAGYIFRLYLRCFHGEASRHGGHGEHQAHESPAVMVLPMAVLAVGAALAGLLTGSPWFHGLFSLLGHHEAHPAPQAISNTLHAVGGTPPHGGGALDVPILVLSTAALALGFSLAWVVGFRRRNLLPEPLRPLGRRLYTLAYHKYYIDELYGRFLIQPFLAATRALARFDHAVIDAAVNGAGRLGGAIGELKREVDERVIDAAVNGIARVAKDAGEALRWILSGIIQQSLLVVVVSVVALSIALLR